MCSTYPLQLGHPTELVDAGSTVDLGAVLSITHKHLLTTGADGAVHLSTIVIKQVRTLHEHVLWEKENTGICGGREREMERGEEGERGRMKEEERGRGEEGEREREEKGWKREEKERGRGNLN